MGRVIRKIRFSLASIILVCSAGATFSLDLTAEYIDGYLDLKDGQEWIEVFIGDTIADTAVVRLAEDSIAELRSTGVKLTLTKPGVYEIGTLIKASGDQRSAGLAAVVGSKVMSLFSEKRAESQTAVMGVRGAKSESTVKWMTGDTAELVTAGKKYLQEHEPAKALAQFQDAYEFSEIDEETEVLFYLAYTAYIMENLRDAADYLQEIVEVNTDAEFFPKLYLLYGQVLTETFAFQDAIDWIKLYIDADTIDEGVRQTALFLEGMNYKFIEDGANAQKAFSESLSVDPDTDVGKAAAAMLDKLK